MDPSQASGLLTRCITLHGTGTDSCLQRSQKTDPSSRFNTSWLLQAGHCSLEEHPSPPVGYTHHLTWLQRSNADQRVIKEENAIHVTILLWQKWKYSVYSKPFPPSVMRDSCIPVQRTLNKFRSAFLSS